jgi:phosphatidylglycerophosphatase A
MRADSLSVALLKDPVHLVALGFGAGLSPVGPGTVGSLLALAPAWLIAGWPWPWRLLLVACAFFAGVWICGESARRLQCRDPGAIVFDEIVGMLATSLALAPDLAGLFLAFGLFRLFDIVKPWPIRDLDHRLHGGFGIMLDDVVAALYAAVCLQVVQALFSIA